MSDLVQRLRNRFKVAYDCRTGETVSREDVCDIIGLLDEIAQLRADADRMDFLDRAANNGVLTAALDLDGGVNLRISSMGEDPREVRSAKDLRAAIDAQRAGEKSNG